MVLEDLSIIFRNTNCEDAKKEKTAKTLRREEIIKK